LRRMIVVALCFGAWAAISAGSAYAWHLNGFVKCPNGTVFNNVVVTVTVAGSGTFVAANNTDAAGYYFIGGLPNVPASYTATLDPTNLPPDAIVTGGLSRNFSLTDAQPTASIDWAVNTAVCEACWFTGGGAKIDQLVDVPVAERLNTKPRTQLSFGGNVYPGCSPTAGDGGSWNHVDRVRNLHFHGTAIQVVDCGNVPGIPPGSTSPVTPYNFIDFQGTGTLKGIQGNKADYGIVCFTARAEDRNEPGSSGAKDGALIDRYFLRVFNCDTAETYLLVSNGGSVARADTLPITDGNFQLHVSSCNTPPAK